MFVFGYSRNMSPTMSNIFTVGYPPVMPNCQTVSESWLCGNAARCTNACSFPASYHESWLASWSWICFSNQVGACRLDAAAMILPPPNSAWLIISNCDPHLPYPWAQTPPRPSHWVSSVTIRSHAHAHACTRWYSPRALWTRCSVLNAMQCIATWCILI